MLSVLKLVTSASFTTSFPILLASGKPECKGKNTQQACLEMHMTAAADIASERVAGQLSSRVILIAGCFSGIGSETAFALHLTGAHLWVTARDLKKG